MKNNIIHLDQNGFQQFLDSTDKPVLVDFWAEWCGPCRAVAPVLEKLAGESEDNVQVVKVNVDNNRDLAVQFNIRSIPTLLLFKDGKAVAQRVGSATLGELHSFINDNS